MLVLDNRMASENRNLAANSAPVAVTSTTDQTSASSTGGQAETPKTNSSSTESTAPATSDNVAEIHEASNNLAGSTTTQESTPTATTTESSEPVSFDLGQSLVETLDSSLMIIKNISSEETAKAALEDLNAQTETLTGFGSLTKLLPQAGKEAVANLAKNAGPSFDTAFNDANSHKGVEAILANTQKKFVDALTALE